MIDVLVVDDESEITEFMTDLLELNRCRVFSALRGEDAIDLARKNSFDIAFIDICLPGIDGVETMTSLMEIVPDARYILMTGACCEERIDEGINAGALRCLIKPFQIDDVLEFVAGSGANNCQT
ncbi:MAG: response regulator [Candidatus Krumholzibacteriota bacterium]|nr:response regulator [Candidatus Krumholzibacteriota bacterium]